MKKEQENSFFEFINDILGFFASVGKSVLPKKLSPEQVVLLFNDEVLVKQRAKEKSDVHYTRENEYEERHNNICPNCGAKKGEIVNKIREVSGSGSGHVSGNLFGISGSSSMSIGTGGVNHCNKCGNEWKKYNKTYMGSSEPPRDGVKYVARVIQDPVEYKWADSLIQIFEGCYVETILKFAEDCRYSLMDSDIEVLNFNTLNKYFKSIWDDPNVPKTLLKLL